MAASQPAGTLVGRCVGAYRILAPLGQGGMGEVYLAEDTRLSRRVALKVLPPDLAAQPEKIERFEREARAVAALSHPGIVVLHSIEEADGIRFLTLEHVEGETLGKAIPERGFPMARFLPLAVALADAVSAAHRRGILHRDLKPENVMLTSEGRLKVLDFGLAKLRTEFPESTDRSDRETQSVTQDGRIVGTVAYMSPEQAQGLAVDHRSDIFSLGILLYEMATGERPFKGGTNLSVLSAILKDTPRPVTDLRDDIPRPLARMIQRALEKRPEDRYQSTDDLRRDLEDLKRDVDSGELRATTTADRQTLLPAGGAGRRRLVPVALIGGLALLVLLPILVVRERHRAAAGRDQRRSVAVFYFDNLSAEPKLDWLRTGLTDMLVTGLSQSTGLRVVGTGRLYELLAETGHKDEASPSAQVVASVARRANVATALLGSFVRAGPLLRIQARLQDPTTGEVLASERVEGDAETGLFTLVDELTSRIRGRLEASKGGERHLQDVTTTSIEAYRQYAEGSRLHDRSREREALPFFERAVAADPGFSTALAKLSVVHSNLSDVQKAREYAARAIERADRLPPGERHYIEGWYYSLDATTLQKSIEAYQAAVDAAPDHTAARNNLAQGLITARRYSEAVVHLEELRRRGMTFAGTYGSLAEVYSALGQDAKAEEVLRAYVAEHPDLGAGLNQLAAFLAVRGRLDEALATCARVQQLDPRDASVDLLRFAIYVVQADWDKAEAAAKRSSASKERLEGLRGAIDLALLRLYRGDLAGARRLIDELLAAAVGRADDRASLRIALANLESDLGRDEAGLAEAERALDEAPANPELRALAHRRAALLLTHLKRTEAAKPHVEAVQSFLRQVPASVSEPQGLRFQGDLAIARGDATAALALYRKVVAAWPERSIKVDSGAVERDFGRAQAALALGQGDEARQALLKVVDAGVGRLERPVIYVRSLAQLGRLEEQAGRPAEARRLYQRYLACWKGGQIDAAETSKVEARLAALPQPAP